MSKGEVAGTDGPGTRKERIPSAISRKGASISNGAGNRKGGTPSSRKHHFEAFSQRIAKLRIEPVRRGRATIIADDELDTAFSHFRTSLQEWRDLNISDVFSSFARQVAPLCDSLPQLLHHSDRIIDLLVEHIEKGDKWSEEPLLSLMAHFAHDLGVRFEKYFGRVVKVLSQLAATHQDVEVIEWSFTCLAWLFKYLSRLLVPDLRPLLDLMAPLLGKEHQKAFISRFAADSMSFLVRKAGAVYHRDKEPLRLLLSHISGQLEESQGNGRDAEYRQGLMSLFADSIKGVQRGLHSSALAIYEEMLIQTYAEKYAALHNAPLEPILSGVIIATIHHSDAETFQPVLNTILAQVEAATARNSARGLSSRLLFTVAGVRKGTRIQDWNAVLDALEQLLLSVNNSGDGAGEDTRSAIPAAAIIFQYCPLDTAIAYVRVLESLAREDVWQRHFIPFCSILADTGSERFKTLVLPTFKRFVAQKAHDHRFELGVVVPEFIRSSALTPVSLQPSARWYDQLLESHKALAHESDSATDTMAYECNAFLEAYNCFVVPTETKVALASLLQTALENALNISESETPATTHLVATGRGMQHLALQSNQKESVLRMWPSICKNSLVYGHYVPFWQGLQSLISRNEEQPDFTGEHTETLKEALLRCLGSPSHDLRLVALEVISIITAKSEAPYDIITIAMLIEQTPLSLETARSISMRMRQLAKAYPALSSQFWVREVIPTYCFGLLHAGMAQVWDDACATLKAISETKDGETVVSHIAIEWLQEIHQQNGISHTEAPNGITSRRRATHFECTNLMQLQEIIADKQGLVQDIHERLKSTFEAEYTKNNLATAFNRTQSLRLLNIIPQVAEKRSRLLVPVLLEWVLSEPSSDAPEGDSEKLHWSRKDQKALLSVFSKFINPSVLFRSNDVYSALLVLLGNGDVEIQKSALQAILTWKDPAVMRYQENLFSILDDARFREEITVFMDASEDESHLQQHHVEQLLPLILRLLYGKVISGKKVLDAKRKAVFIALTRFGERAIRQFLNIALGPLKGISILKAGTLDEGLLKTELVAPRKQLGLLNMMEDLLSTLGTTAEPHAGDVIDALLYCLIRTSRNVPMDSHAVDSPEPSGEEHSNAKDTLSRTIRQRAFHSLNILFEKCPNFPWHPYVSVIVEELVKPRLANFAIETAQSVSGLLRMFSAWSKHPQTVRFLVAFNKDILTRVVDCLDVPSAKDEVKLFILNNVLRTAIGLAGSDESTYPPANSPKHDIVSEIIEPYANLILLKSGDLLRKSPSKDLLESAVRTVAELAPYMSGASESRNMIEIATFLIRQPPNRVNTQTKLELLKILHNFIPQCGKGELRTIFDSVFNAVTSSFAIVPSRDGRSLLCQILQDLASSSDEDLLEVAHLCQLMNAFDNSRLDEPDFDSRAKAYTAINEERREPFSVRQWQPIVYNALYYIKDNEELSTRVSASLTLRRFIDASINDEEAFKELLSSALLPGIQNGMRETSELVRAEFLAVLAHLIKTHPQWAPVADLTVLLSSDEEAAVFNNILHVQTHRRLRALRRITACAPQLQSTNISHLLIPLLEHFVFDKGEDESAQNLAGDTIRTLGSLAQCLEWPQYRALLRRYIGYLSSKEDMQKTVVKLLSGMTDALNQAGATKGYISRPLQENTSNSDASERPDQMDVDSPTPSLARTMPARDKLTLDLINNILPPLNNFLRKRDETTVSLRVPVAVAVIKALQLIATTEFEARLPTVLLDVCQILKSKSYEARNMSRNTLAEIAELLGPAYLGFLLKSMRTSLQRGYQLHVLSYTVHHILVQMVPGLKTGDLNYCLADIVDVVMDDIFGATGQEKDAEDYISKMKEVKSSKSYDTLDLLARVTPPDHMGALTAPIRSLLLEKLNLRMINKSDELLRRVGLGLLNNPAVQSREFLVFCYELVKGTPQLTVNEAAKDDDRRKRYLVTIKGAAKSGARGASSSHAYKVIRFGLDILRTVLRKHAELQTPQNLAGFLPIIGDALVQGQEEVQISAIRLLTTIIKVQLPALDDNCPIYVTEAVHRIKNAPSSNTELAQASLKLISSILRDRPLVTVKERDIAQLLKRLLPDLDEPDRQGVTFGFLKAVMNRKIIITEVYEVMDKVSAMMITNQSRSARDLARSHYLQFLMDYPQAKNRFSKQVEFLIRNLRFEHVEGRQSVMEALNVILTKVGDDVLQDILGMMFIPLVNTMANDDSSDCRTMAAALVGKLFERADTQLMKSFHSDFNGWLEQDDDAGLKRLGIQCYGLYLEVTEVGAQETSSFLRQLKDLITHSLSRRDEDDWELLYYALTAFSKLCKTAVDIAISQKQRALWETVQQCVSYPHAWVKLSAAKLMGYYFADLQGANSEGLKALPLEGSSGLSLTGEDMVQLANAFLNNMSSSHTTEELCSQSAKNLVFLARCLAANGMEWRWQSVGEEDIDAVDITEEIDAENDPASDNEWGGFSDPAEKPPSSSKQKPTSAVHRIMVRLSTLLRRETKIIKLSSLFHKTTAISLIDILCKKLPSTSYGSALPHVLTTLHTLTAETTSRPHSTDPRFNETYQGLIDKAREIMNEVLQHQLGSSEYIALMQDVQKTVRQRRDERKQKRKVEAITMPEKHGKEKKRRHELKRVKRKERNAEYQGKRNQY